MTVAGILDWLTACYPLETACDFDNVGLLIGDRSAEVTSVLLALDADRTALQRAGQECCELVITHHPVLWDPPKAVLAEDTLYEWIRSGKSVIGLHTNLDSGRGGVNDCLCEALGLTDTVPVPGPDGLTVRGGRSPWQSPAELADEIHRRLGSAVRFVAGKKPIRTVLVCSGSGGDLLATALAGGYDALITGEARHHQLVAAADAGISLFEAGHFATEDVVIEPLAARLRAQFPSVRFVTHHPGFWEYR